MNYLLDPQPLLSRLAKVRRVAENKWIAGCPAHDDRMPSLSIRQTEERLLLHCYAGCEVEAIVAALGLELSDLFAGTAQHANLQDRDASLRARAERGLQRWHDAVIQRVAEELRERDNMARTAHEAIAAGTIGEDAACDKLARAYIGYSELEDYFERLLREEPLKLWREAQHE